jgi:hypothetical protein
MSHRNVLLVVAALGAAGCGRTSAPGTEKDDFGIIGGFDGSAPSLNAVGALVLRNDEGAYEPFCTGTLIAPNRVVTAKHCLQMDPRSKIAFAIGPDATAPISIHPVDYWEVSPVSHGGWGSAEGDGLGSDVGVLYLETPVEGITLIPLADEPLTSADMGRSFLSIGYGLQFATFPLNPEDHRPTRRMGFQGLRALEGQVYQLMFGSLEAYLANESGVRGSELSEVEREQLTFTYNMQWLLPQYEVYVGALEGNVQACFGDSGGPLLGVVNGERRVYGVVTGGAMTPEMICGPGTVYAIFGPETKAFLQEALNRQGDPCGDLEFGGTCEGAVAARCTGPSEGPRRPIRLDCAELGMVCGAAPDGMVSCLDR